MASRQRTPALRNTSTHLREGVPFHRVVRGIRRSMLGWFDANRRPFFWRDNAVSPFAILVTEILLTKTRAEAAEPVATQVLGRYGTPLQLARARPTTLAKLLYPLGLHEKRARGLVDCAKELVEAHRGVVPSAVSELQSLPHVGRYAANAIACVAFGQRVGIMDANVARIYGRAFVLPPAPPRLSTAHNLWNLADRLVPARRTKEFNWGLLDLGSAICTPKNPHCDRCPISSYCGSATREGHPSRHRKSPLHTTRRT